MNTKNGLTWAFAFAMSIPAFFAQTQPTLSGEWEAKPREERLQLNLRTGSWTNDWNMGFGVKWPEVRGLSAASFSQDQPVRFELVRDAGTIAFDGATRSGRASGDFRFVANAEFISGMSQMGFRNLSDKELFSMAVHNISPPR